MTRTRIRLTARLPSRRSLPPAGLRRKRSAQIAATSSFVSTDFPRTITWGIDRHGIRWLTRQTDPNQEFRGPTC